MIEKTGGGGQATQGVPGRDTHTGPTQEQPSENRQEGGLKDTEGHKQTAKPIKQAHGTVG